MKQGSVILLTKLGGPESSSSILSENALLALWDLFLITDKELVLTFASSFQNACDMIKRNESDVGHIVFETLAKSMFKFLCFILFLALTNSS